MSATDVKPEDLIAAVAEMVGRTGATSFQVRYSDDEEPTVWMAVGQWGKHWEAAAALTPHKAAVRLAELVIDGGECTHCHRATSISEDWALPVPEVLDKALCWYIYDPETKRFRRNCEGS